MARMSLAEFHATQQKKSTEESSLQKNSKRLSLLEWHALNVEKEKQSKEQADAATSALEGAASGSAGVSGTLQPAQDDGTLFGRKPLGVLGAVAKAAGVAERTVDAFGAIDPEATAKSALGATQQALGTAIQAPTEQVAQALGPMQLLVEAAAGKPWAIKKLQEAETQSDIIRAGLETESP